ncbi:MAG: hypothetical protein GY937_01620 [bacterium]|nr:hypothetical protein [bacterium]
MKRIHAIEEPAAFEALRAAQTHAALDVPEFQGTLDFLAAWSAAMAEADLGDVLGLPFLRLWLREQTLLGVIRREFGENGPAVFRGELDKHGRFVRPVGTVFHWTAGNVGVQPFLSLTAGMLAGNHGLVRVPDKLVADTERLLECAAACPGGEDFLARNLFLTFPHEDQAVAAAVAEASDAAMIWGGEEAVLTVRALPFPHWAHLQVFGPRVSVAMMDAATWAGAGAAVWARRLVRDLWQFDQEACSSPITLYLQADAAANDEALRRFVGLLRDTCAEENRLHPRDSIAPAQTGRILAGRAAWLTAEGGHWAEYPKTPDWTLLVGEGAELAEPIRGRTLRIQVVKDLVAVLAGLDGGVQTLGTGFGAPALEARVARVAATRGIDRVVKLGRMHNFGTPWDGRDLVRPMCRLVQFTPSAETIEEDR